MDELVFEIIEHVMLLHKNNVMILFKFYCFALFGLDLQDLMA